MQCISDKSVTASFVALTKDDGEVVGYSFNQEDIVEALVDVFKQLGVDDVKYEEVY